MNEASQARMKNVREMKSLALENYAKKLMDESCLNKDMRTDRSLHVRKLSSLKNS